MKRGETQAQNHPGKGSSIKVEPITDLVAIARIKARLRRENLRNYCLFVLGINTAYRASDLLALRVGQVAHLRPGDLLEVKEKKTGNHRAVTMNCAAVEAVQAWLAVHPRRDDPRAPLFPSKHGRGRRAIHVETLNHLVKGWCRLAGLQGRYGSHTLRKSWGYHQRLDNEAPLPLLTVAYGHHSEAQTLTYLHIQEQELQELFYGYEL